MISKGIASDESSYPPSFLEVISGDLAGSSYPHSEPKTWQTATRRIAWYTTDAFRDQRRTIAEAISSSLGGKGRSDYFALSEVNV